MERFAVKAVLAVSAASALLAAQPAPAATGCWDQQQSAAARVRDFQSRLMVAALRCRAMGPMGAELLAAYNDFVRQNRSALQAENGLIHARFETGYGKDADTYYDQFATGLANHYGGDATTPEICREAAAAAEEGAAAAGDVGKLVALADRFGMTPDLPGGACEAPVAPLAAARTPAPVAPLAAARRPAAAMAFAAVMDEALADASDPPRAPGTALAEDPR